MGEAPQSMEARAVSAMIHALNGGRLARVLLIGDDLQLPPTLAATRNPMAATGRMSLFERLIKADFPVITLRTQFRMHSSISRVVNSEIYSDVGGIQNGSHTDDPARGVSKFQTFIKGLASFCGRSSFPDTNAAVISPKEDPNLSWSAQTVQGSTAKFNLVTARIVLQVAYMAMEKGGFAASDLMVIAFYRDQVQLLKSLFEATPKFNGVDISTVDSSQGSERKLVIIDTTVLGAANGDGMGFLNEDKRRFCVAMSRAQIGRIVVAHEGMIGKLGGEEEKRAGPWNGFFREAGQVGSIINGAKLNAPIANKTLRDRLVGVFTTWSSKVRQDSKPVGHRNIVNASKAEGPKAWRDGDYERTTFIELTGAGDSDAESYLRKAKGELHVAVDNYFGDHGLGGDVIEEIGS